MGRLTGSTSVAAPVRVDLSPGFPDVAPFCTMMRGYVVNVALDLEVQVARAQDGRREGGFVDGLVSEIAALLGVPKPTLACRTREVPTGCGLGSSGAVSVAIAYATALEATRAVDLVEVVAVASAAERAVGVTAGTQDQLASAYGGAGLVERYRDVGRRRALAVNFAALAERLTLVRPGGARHSGSIIDAVLRDGSRQAGLAVVRDMNAVGLATADALQDDDFDGLTRCVSASVDLLGRLHPAIVDRSIADLLRSSGAAAAKPCGAGGPGAVWLVLTEPAARGAFRRSIVARGLRVLEAGLSPHGVRLVAEPGDVATAPWRR